MSKASNLNTNTLKQFLTIKTTFDRKLFFILYILLTSVFAFSSKAQPNEIAVRYERGDGKWNFPSIPRPSRSDIGLNSKIYIAGNRLSLSCLSPDGLHIGVLPWEGKQQRDFLSFSDYNSRGGKIFMDLGKKQSVYSVISYSWQDTIRIRNWGNSLLDGRCAPQVYTLYGSKRDQPDTTSFENGDWVKLANIDTRPTKKDSKWYGQYASMVQNSNNEILGEFRWIAWEVQSTFKEGANPRFTSTWYTELDVHTAETIKKAGDAVMAGSELEEIIVSFKTHFDIGFTHTAPEIVDIYRTKMIDHALDLIDESKKLPPDEQFNWTIPSWVAEQILWKGQDEKRRTRFIKALKDNSITVHALPITPEYSTNDLEGVAASLSHNVKVAREAGIPLARAGKITDVPSQPWIVPTALTNAGINFLHIGVNPGAVRPDVPLLFNWEGPDNSKLLTMCVQGYGTDAEFMKGIYPPKDWKYKNWLALLMTPDNVGPPRISEVQKILKEAKQNLPGVKITLGNLEDFSERVKEEEKMGAEIPVVRADMPDNWIHGVGSMPLENTLARSIQNKRIAAGSLNTHLKAWGMHPENIKEKLDTAYERDMMYSEHTWGGARNLDGKDVYNVKDFDNYINTSKECQYLESTWNDHANYARKSASVIEAIAANELTLLAKNINIEGERIVVFNPLPYRRDAIVEIPNHPGAKFLAKNLPPSGYKAWRLNEVLSQVRQSTEKEMAGSVVMENEYLKVTIDREKGGIISVIDKSNGKEMVDPNAKYAFGQYLYQRYDYETSKVWEEDWTYPFSCYGNPTQWNIRRDLPRNVRHEKHTPTYAKMTFDVDEVEQKVMLFAKADSNIASDVTTTISLPKHSPWFEISIDIKDKKPDYWPESGSFYFSVNAKSPQFRVGRLGGIVNPEKDYAVATSRTYNFVENGAIIADNNGNGLAICPIDHRMMSFGKKGLMTFDPYYVPKTPECLVGIYNNLWTINYPYWVKGSFQSRVRIWITHNLDASGLIEGSTEAHHPVLAVVADGAAGKLPVSLNGLSLSGKGVELTYFGPNRDGDGIVLRLWEQEGKNSKVTVTLPAKNQFSTYTPINLRGEIIGSTESIENGEMKLNIGAYSPKSYLLQ